MSDMTPNYGDLRVWWIPQVPMKPFHFPVDSVEQAVHDLRLLAEYDKFQYENRVRPDYCNAGGLEVYVEDCDGEGNPGWEDWSDDEQTIDEVMAEQEEEQGD